ncbi:MAG: hypothetical protein JNJ45_00485 [Chthonomonas sp.]|nr:hypothetical protein [Chthonomonas sp.]
MKDFHAEHHVQPASLYFKTAFALAILMGATIAAAFMPKFAPVLATTAWGSWVMNIIALGIAVFKATLVIRIFMGVKFADEITKMYAVGGFVWVTFMTIMFIDYFSRPYENVQGWEKTHPAAMPRAAYPDDHELDTTKQNPIRPFQQN